MRLPSLGCLSAFAALAVSFLFVVWYGSNAGGVDFVLARFGCVCGACAHAPYIAPLNNSLVDLFGYIRVGLNSPAWLEIRFFLPQSTQHSDMSLTMSATHKSCRRHRGHVGSIIAVSMSLGGPVEKT